MFLGWSLGTGEPIGVLFSGKEYLCSKLFSVANSCLVGLRLHGVFSMSFVMFVHILLVQLQLEQLYWGDIIGIASNGTRWHNVTAKPLILSGSYNLNQVSLCNVFYMHSIGSHKPSLLYGPQPSIAHPHLSSSTPMSPFYFQTSCVLLFSLLLSPKIIFIFIFSFFSGSCIYHFHTNFEKYILLLEHNCCMWHQVVFD